VQDLHELILRAGRQRGFQDGAAVGPQRLQEPARLATAQDDQQGRGAGLEQVLDAAPELTLATAIDTLVRFAAARPHTAQLLVGEAMGGGSTSRQLRADGIAEIAEMIESVVPGAQATFAEGGGPDKRSYQVDCSKIQRVLPGFKPRWTVPTGVEELYEAYTSRGLTFEDFTGSRYLRIKRVQELQDAGRVDQDLRWLTSVGVER